MTTIESQEICLRPDRMVLAKEKDQQVDLDCQEKDLKTSNVRNWKSQVENTGQPGMECLKKSRPTLGCRTIEEGRNV
ncbi:hypothetical protein TNCV_3830721 [Trichonephila clavipes]|nr:hypothetical protein TNCV_3830721 [Trichonephila clavipes]